MSCWEDVIVGTFISIVGCCCALTKIIRGRREPVTVDVQYMQDRMERQRQDMANVWSRDRNARSQGAMSSIGRRSTSSHGDLSSTRGRRVARSVF